MSGEDIVWLVMLSAFVAIGMTVIVYIAWSGIHLGGPGSDRSKMK